MLTWINFPFDSISWFKRYLDILNSWNYAPKILEKDFYLTAVLGRISKELPDLSFKWWTCLNKVHFPYFRLSEDLDFSLPIDLELVNNPGKRKRYATHMKSKMELIAHTMWRTLERKNDRARGNKYIRNKKNTHLEYTLGYTSIYGWPDTIKVELTYTHKQCVPSVFWSIQHIYVDVIVDMESLFPEMQIKCLDISEMIAEKTRAALTRQKPAIRDFYDLRYMICKKWYVLQDYIDLIKEKCEDTDWRRTIETFVPDRDFPDVQKQTLPYLESQIQEELHPVLINQEFDLQLIYKQVIEIKALLSEIQVS